MFSTKTIQPQSSRVYTVKLQNCNHFKMSAFNTNSQHKNILHNSLVVSGWAGWSLAHLEFGSSVNPIPTSGDGGGGRGGGRLCPPHYYFLPPLDLKTQRHLCIRCAQMSVISWSNMQTRAIVAKFPFTLWVSFVQKSL